MKFKNINKYIRIKEMNNIKGKKKVGILTLPLGTNYGGVLQAYALLKYLKNNNYNAYFINRRWDNNRTDLFYKFQKWFYRNIFARNFTKFIENHLRPSTFEMTSQKDIFKINEMNFDAVIVGSDQVWRVENTSGVGNNFFLDFIEDNNIKKLSYAASFGINEIKCSDYKLKEIKSLINDFDAVSVREDSGVDICKNKFNVLAERLLDPTMLLEESDYLDLINKNVFLNNNQLTTYVLDKTDEKMKIVNEISNKKNLKVKSVNTELKSFDIKNLLLNINEIVLPSIEQWIKGFSEADFIVTDSFHGTLFSILFNKQFVSIGNKRRGLTRFQSILGLFDLDERLILTSDDLNADLLNKKIEYDRINKIINREREKTLNFLKENL